MTNEPQSRFNTRRSILAACVIVYVLAVAISGVVHIHLHLANQPAHEHCSLCLHVSHLVAICVVVADLLLWRERGEFIRAWDKPTMLQEILWLPLVRPPPAF